MGMAVKRKKKSGWQSAIDTCKVKSHPSASSISTGVHLSLLCRERVYCSRNKSKVDKVFKENNSEDEKQTMAASGP